MVEGDDLEALRRQRVDKGRVPQAEDTAEAMRQYDRLPLPTER